MHKNYKETNQEERNMKQKQRRGRRVESLPTRICREMKRKKQPKFHAGASSEVLAMRFMVYL